MTYIEMAVYAILYIGIAWMIFAAGANAQFAWTHPKDHPFYRQAVWVAVSMGLGVITTGLAMTLGGIAPWQ